MGLNNSQYDSIKRTYEQTQLKNRHLLVERHEEVYQKAPNFKEIEDSISSLCVAQGKKMLEGDDSALAHMKEQLQLLRKQKRIILAENGFPENYLEPIYHCPVCKDSGYHNLQKCSCFKQAEIRFLYEQSNIEGMLQNENFEQLSYDFYEGDDLVKFENAVLSCKNFIKNFDNVYHNLLFYGTVGTGKSFLSGCIAKELIETGHSVIYFSSLNLFDSLAKNTFDYKARENLSAMYDDLFQCDLLIIDDLGTEISNAFVVSELFTILNERNLRNKAMIISTNLSLQDVSNRYSERIFSRLTSNFDLLKLTGKDIRMYKKRTENRK